MLRLFDNGKEVVYDVNKYLTDVFPLENFSAFGFYMDGVYFRTGEHAFQFLKFDDEKICNEILKCSNPYDARNVGRKYKDLRISNWVEVKYGLLEKVFSAKVEQNPIVRECLLNTFDYTICEYCVDEDTEWGLDSNGNGENRLGRALMNVRDGFK